MFIDTHCHIHESGFYKDDREAVYQRAIAADVKMICIGTSEQFSAEALEFAKTHDDTWATIGVHPHDTKEGWQRVGPLLQSEQSHFRNGFAPRSTRAPAPGQTWAADVSENEPAHSDTPVSKIVGIGEIGLDYYYDNSPRDIQIRALEEQLQWAVDYDLPVSFHVREAYQDFWPIFDNFPGLGGVLHSYTDDEKNLETALGKGLFIGINGISTFARDKQAMFDAVPLERMLLETDAPFLTPTPHRGKVNEPAFVRNVAEYHADRRGVELEHLARATSANASMLFHL